MSIQTAFFDLQETDRAFVRKQFEENNMKLTIDITSFYRCTMHPISRMQWNSELDFWKAVKGVRVIINMS